MPVIARWIAPLALAFGLGAASLMPPTSSCVEAPHITAMAATTTG